jgi:hypothetical protein
MNKFKKTSMLLAGVLGLFLFSYSSVFAQKASKRQNKKIVSSIRDSAEALEKIKVELKNHEKIVNLSQEEYLTGVEKLKQFRCRLDSISSMISYLSRLDSSSAEFKFLSIASNFLGATLESEILVFSEEQKSLNKRNLEVNEKTKYLFRREKELTDYLNHFKK